MPIRIRKDKGSASNNNKPSYNRRSSGRRSSGGGGGIASALIPILISLFRKNPKMGIIIIVVLGIGYFVMGSGGNTNSPSKIASIVQSFAGTGLEMDEKVYDEAEVFEPLADNIKNPMPERVTLEEFCPTRKNQGSQGSCVGWSSAYAARTILQARATGENPNKVAFSPSFLYNQISLEGCQGTYLQKAMEVMKSRGALPFSKFAYDQNSCSHKPNSSDFQVASAYTTKGFNRLSKSGDNYKTDLLAIKQNLAQGAPVVIGMMVGGSFMSKMQGKELWTPTRSDYDMKGFGGHAICVIGYDDYKTNNEGAFQIMNSWGEDWGKKGLFWIRYSDFEHFTREAYGLYPMGSSEVTNTTKLDAEIGIVYNKTGKYLPFKYNNGIEFESTELLTIDEDFKVEITNSMECYTYIFGEETDGSSYVLFPYTAKHSPYCGITGTRLFPKDHSLFADAKGRKDHFAIVVSKQKLDYNKLNQHFNNANGTTYQDKVSTALQGELIENVSFSGGKTIKFTTSSTTNNMVAVVLSVAK